MGPGAGVVGPHNRPAPRGVVSPHPVTFHAPSNPARPDLLDEGALPNVRAMQLTAEQQDVVRQWIADGLKLSDVQKRLESEFGLRPSYMEVRFLVDDLKVMPKDPEPPKVPEKTEAVPATAPAEPSLGGVRVTVDAVTRPNSMVSGRVVFSDGQGAAWLVDQYGRPGLVADTKGYRPSPQDMQEFQIALEKELVRLGL